VNEENHNTLVWLMLASNGKMATYATPGGYKSENNKVQNRYLEKLSGPLLDRIDLHIEVPSVPYRELTSKRPGTDSTNMRSQVATARATQQKRFNNQTNGSTLLTASNAKMDSKHLKQFCELSEQCLLLMKQAMDELGLSARAYDKVRRVARTIADLEGSPMINENHLAEAIQYRLLDRRF
jgi:magnesium chelatase family protein